MIISVKLCPVDIVAHSRRSVTDAYITYGSRITYYCDSGYYVDDGIFKFTSTCKNDYTLSDMQTCRSKQKTQTHGMLTRTSQFGPDTQCYTIISYLSIRPSTYWTIVMGAHQKKTSNCKRWMTNLITQPTLKLSS